MPRPIIICRDCGDQHRHEAFGLCQKCYTRRRRAGSEMPPSIRRPLHERFWEKVDRSGGDDACWIWTGAIISTGYGSIRIDGRGKLSHRISWELVNGSIPQNKLVLHKCDNPPCVNPEHLFIGTYLDNVVDMYAKRRGRAKLTEEKVKEIRRRRAGGESRVVLSREYGVTHAAIYLIDTGKNWAHVK